MAFGRLERRPATEPMSAINVTPLIDVMLVLLVIFIITAPLLTSGLRLDLPPSDASAPAEPAAAVLAVAVDAEGRLYLDEMPVDSATLRARAVAAAAADADTEVHLRADRRVPYGRVAELIGWMQGAGLLRIGFVTEPADGAADTAVDASPQPTAD
jgi:biopolymer transport protein TolR